MTLSLILATALPARAGDRNDDLAKALIAAVVIGAIIHESKRDDPPPSSRQNPSARKKPLRSMSGTTASPPSAPVNSRGSPYHHRLPRTLPAPRRRAGPPALPLRDRSARIRGKRDRVYTERCLRDAGFEMPGKRHRY